MSHKPSFSVPIHTSFRFVLATLCLVFLSQTDIFKTKWSVSYVLDITDKLHIQQNHIAPGGEKKTFILETTFFALLGSPCRSTQTTRSSSTPHPDHYTDYSRIRCRYDVTRFVASHLQDRTPLQIYSLLYASVCVCWKLFVVCLGINVRFVYLTIVLDRECLVTESRYVCIGCPHLYIWT